MKRSRESGQVLITGVVMLAILLLIILYAFDVHNVIRAKLKVDIAQQSAAMTGAAWQKESLNLLGEINLLKASALLMEGSENWKTALPDREKEDPAWHREMQNRVDLLTEMQTRITFIGPLVGFAAAQQAAKNNGLNRINGGLSTYLELLETDKRYDESRGGAKAHINNYAWQEPYKNLVSRINDNGIAVFPNARTAGIPVTRPAQLANERFYTEIMRAVYAVSANDPPKTHHWFHLNSLLRTMDDADFQGKWWQIDYEHNPFPNESEIFTLGVEFGGDYNNDNSNTSAILNSLKPDLQIYADNGSLPAQMKWCIYDSWWLPDYYINRFPEYKYNHFDYWFGGGVLRKNVKKQHIYEGPAAYVEGYADVRAKVNVRPSVRPYDDRPYATGILKRDARDAMRRRENSILIKNRSRTTTRVGTRRTEAADSNIITDYRPGSIAKVLGELQDNTAPIEVDIILPVFKQVSPMPTFMPVPYGFQVLKPGYSNLEKFLSWLSEQDSLDGIPPEGTEHYLEALRFLVNGVRGRARGQSGEVAPEMNGSVSGRGLRYYGYNHKFNKGAFDNEFKDKLWEWEEVRDKRVFQQTVPDGPGRLQEPQLFSNEPHLKRITVKEKDQNGRIIEKKYYVVSREEENGYQDYRLDEKTHKVPMPDSINGGTAHRVYVDIKNNSSRYYVINSRGNIILSGGSDPTIIYNRYFGGGKKCNCQGECTCKSVWNPSGYDGSRGPVRL